MRFSDYVVVYDITSDTERSRIDKLLKGFGRRAQKSVFECRLDKRSKTELIERLQQENLKTGFVKVYRLEFSSEGKTIGTMPKKEDIDHGTAYIV